MSHIIPGPAGELELLASDSDAANWAILCHPHPLYGGSMHDAVLDTVHAQLVSAGFGTVRFNFRGVGASEGEHNGGAGEVDDVLAVRAWLEGERSPGRLWLAGYSFGSNVAWNAARSGGSVDRVLLIAPPLGAMPFEGEIGSPTNVVVGTDDQFCGARALDDWQARTARIQIKRIQGADHFFTGRHDALASAILGVFDPG